MATKRTGNPKGRPPKNPAKPKSNRVELEPDQVKRLSKLLTNCVEEGLKYAEQILSNNEQVQVERFTRHGETERFKHDKYSPELKLRILEILVGKVFAEKKDIGIEPADPNAINVVGFKFTPAEKKPETEQQEA